MTPKSAEALRVEAHEAHDRCCIIEHQAQRGEGLPGDHCRVTAAIDLAIAARAAEVGEQMHAPNCACRFTFPDGACGVYVGYVGDDRCLEARARYRAEVERLSRG